MHARPGQILSDPVVGGGLYLAFRYPVAPHRTTRSFNVSQSVPWHVTKNYEIFVNLNSLESKNDVTTDCWWWCRQQKTYKVVTRDTGKIFSQISRKDTDIYKVVQRSRASQNYAKLEEVVCL